MTCPFHIPARSLAEAPRTRPIEVNIDHTKTGEAERSDGSEKLNWKGQAAGKAGHVGRPRDGNEKVEHYTVNHCRTVMEIKI